MYIPVSGLFFFATSLTVNLSDIFMKREDMSVPNEVDSICNAEVEHVGDRWDGLLRWNGEKGRAMRINSAVIGVLEEMPRSGFSVQPLIEAAIVSLGEKGNVSQGKDLKMRPIYP